MRRGWLDIDSSSSSEGAKTVKEREATAVPVATNSQPKRPDATSKSPASPQPILQHGDTSIQLRSQVTPTHGFPPKEAIHPSVKLSLQQSTQHRTADETYTEIMISLLARREIEAELEDRLALRQEKTRTGHFAGSTLDRSNSIEHAIALVECMPTNTRPPDQSDNGKKKEPRLPAIPSLRLPGGRGTQAPSEGFLELGVRTAGPSASPEDKLHHGTLPHLDSSPCIFSKKTKKRIYTYLRVPRTICVDK